jgi:hypothetical protein
VAQLDAAVLADDPVALSLQDFLFLRIHPAWHVGLGLKGFPTIVAKVRDQT